MMDAFYSHRTKGGEVNNRPETRGTVDMERTNTTGSLRKTLAKDIEYLRNHIEIAREMLSDMLADNSEDATRRKDKASSSLDLAYKRLKQMQNDYLSEPLERA